MGYRCQCGMLALVLSLLVRCLFSSMITIVAVSLRDRRHVYGPQCRGYWCVYLYRYVSAICGVDVWLPFWGISVGCGVCRDTGGMYMIVCSAP